LGVPARRCYISDEELTARARAAAVAGSHVAAAKIPDPGSVMSGDFGEILAAFYLASQSLPTVTIDPVKWRYKADRRKAAPHSDVVQLLLPSWPEASNEDRIICAEVKAKATRSQFDPIQDAGAGSALDRGGRLVNTLNWLKDKALTDGSDTVEVAQFERFIAAIDHPEHIRDFRAVAVIDAGFVDDEIAKGTAPEPGECTLVVISVPDLKKRYTELFAEIVASSDLLVPPAINAATATAEPAPPALASPTSGAASIGQAADAAIQRQA
jgi:hypothetical protein